MKRSIIYTLPLFVLAACSQSEKKETKENKTPAAPTYQLAAVEKGGISNTVQLPAQLAAFEEVSIFPKVNGYVKTVLVDVGSKVQPGQLLMTLEAPELVQAVVQAKERYAKSKSAFTIDKERYMRLQEAAKTPGAVSPLDLSTIHENMEADSAQSNAEKANWQMQETMLGYLQVTAPFAGVITERNVHPGALVSANTKDKAMLELKQTAHLRLEVDIPEKLTTRLKENDTVSFYVNALQGKKMTATIVRKAGNINAQYRNERIEADINNSDGLLAPGMYAEVLIYSKEGTLAMRVPKTAVVTAGERKYVLTSKNNFITRVDVTTGNESASSVEVFGALQPGDTVVVNANDQIPVGQVAAR